MAEITYRRIIGCPKHGTVGGRCVTLTNKNTGLEKPAFRCDTCKKVYLEPSTGTMGDIKQKVSGYVIWNTVGPYKLPETVYIFDKKSNIGLCDCKGKTNKKTKAITHFLLKSGKTEPATGVKVCLQCGKVFIPIEVAKGKSEFFALHGVQLCNTSEVHIDDKDNSRKAKATENQAQTKDDARTPVIQDKHTSAVNWEDEVFAIEDTPEDINITALKPANRVASAYYDAKISYNPYQYLPWLKVFINGSKRLLISDEVGLGKTIEAGILIMEQLTENVNAKIIVLCPAFLREKWYQELYEKFYLDSQIYDGKTEIDTMTNIVILPISRIKQYLESETRFDFAMVVIDEIHYFKNSKSVRYGYLQKLLNKINDPIRIFMSATPVNNSGNDYHSIEGLFQSKPDRTNTTKKQAYIHLPERHINDIYVDLTQSEQEFYDATDILDPFSGTIYRHIGASCLYALSKYAYSGEEILSETKEELRNSLEMLMDGKETWEFDDSYFEIMRKLPAPDTDSKLDRLKEILSNYPKGSRIVLFSHYIETVKYLHSELSKLYRSGYIYANSISSNMPCRNIKNKFVDAKNWFCEDQDDTTILICSDTCREGIDLDMANILINYDLPFNPSILEQRIGRIDRMSQKRDMEIFNFHVNGTYDDRLHFILSAKLRFINFYADFGIGNPLNITSEGNHTFESFIRYFGKRIEENKMYASMSNDDYYVAGRILRQIGVKLEKKDGIDALRMQAILLDKLNENQQSIEQWFDKNELNRITEEQLLQQREELEQLLDFPKKIRRKIQIDESVLTKIANKANINPQFRKKISVLIKNYAEKLAEMEVTGLPMRVLESDFETEYSFGIDAADSFIQSSVVEILRKEGASVYEIN